MNQQSQKNKIQAIIVSRPGIMQESLRAALANMSQLEIIKSVGDGLSAWDVIRKQPPNLVVIDSNLLEDEILALLRRIKGKWPAVCCLVLAESARQERWAVASGADAVWQRDRSTRELTEYLAQILPAL